MMNTDTGKYSGSKEGFYTQRSFLQQLWLSICPFMFFTALLCHLWYSHRFCSQAAIYVNPTAALLFFLFFLRELRRVEYIITDDRIIRKSPYKISLIRFTDVLRIKLVKTFPSRGFLVLYSNDGSIKYLYTLRNSIFFLRH